MQDLILKGERRNPRAPSPVLHVGDLETKQDFFCSFWFFSRWQGLLNLPELAGQVSRPGDWSARRHESIEASDG